MEIKQFGVADSGRLDKKWGGLDTAWLVFCQRLDSTVTIFQRDFGSAEQLVEDLRLTPFAARKVVALRTTFLEQGA